MGKQKKKPLPPWSSERIDGADKRFIQIGNSLLLSPRYNSLTLGARHLYLCMMMEAGGNKSFTLPQSAAKKYGVPSSSLRRYIDELVAAGFIIRRSMANLRKPNEYVFSVSWKLPGGSDKTSS